MCLTPKPSLAQGPILPTQGPLRWALPHLLLPFMVEPSPTQGDEVHRFRSNSELLLKAEASFSDSDTVHFPTCVPIRKAPGCGHCKPAQQSPAQETELAFIHMPQATGVLRDTSLSVAPPNDISA